MIRAAAVAAALLACACEGETGTLSVTLTTAPGSTLLDSVQTLRLTITNPRRVVTAERGDDGFSLALELPATGEAAALQVEALDTAGALVASGASPQFPVGALNGQIVVYMAPPLSVGAAPLALTPARSELATSPLPYGALVAGGRLATGAPSDAIAIYNAFDHSIASGLPLPAARSGMALVVGTGSIAYMFGGRDDTGTATATAWRFDTTVPPAGSYADFGTKEGFARADQVAVPIGRERFLITGAPVAELSGLDGSMTARDEVASLPASGVSVTASDGVTTAIFAGQDGVTAYRNGTFTSLPLPSAARTDASVAALPDGQVLVACGTTEAVRIDAASGAGEAFAGVPSVAKTGCAVAATARHLIIAGGSAAGTLDGVVEIYDSTTLALLATAPLVVPRTNAVALALPNGQILIAGGVDAAGAPVGVLELFTPPVE